MFRRVSILVLAACQPLTDRVDDPGDTEDTDVPDLVSALGEGEVRAGVISDPAALWGGVFAEGQPGDIKLYNARVRFVIQAARDGSYIIPEGGGVLDADIVRPEGQLGRDLVKDWHPMAGLGRIVRPTSVEVVADGSDGEAAVVRVTGPAVAMGFLEGNLESPGFLGDPGLTVTHEYRLAPDVDLLEVRTTLRAGDNPVDVAIGDLLMGAPESAWRFVDGGGLDATASSFRWTAYTGTQRDVAVAVLAPPGETLSANGFDLLASATDLAGGFGPVATIAAGGERSSTRLYGVGKDLAVLTDAWLARSGVATRRIEDVVTAPDGPVAGASVAVLVDGEPFTLATTDAEGRFGVDVPTAGEVTLRAVGRATGRFLDHPDGYAPVAPYAHPQVAAAQLQGLVDGAVPVPLAEGRGVASAEAPLTLLQPGTVRVRTGDDLPLAVRVRFTAPDAAVDARYVPGRADGLAAAGWGQDGDLTLAVEPGTYSVLVHRGVRWEVHEEPVVVVAGEEVTVQADLGTPIVHPGWLLADPHAHAVSSGDAAVSMEDRIATSAGVGIQVHFGTDHDRMSDYRPLIAAMDLTGKMSTVVAEEFSPTLRGHFNVYPIEPDPSLPDLGSWRWWDDLRDTTDEMLAFLGERHGDVVIQSNHPTDSGVASSAGWRPGSIRDARKWTTGFHAIEVLNGGSHDEFEGFWFDLLHRGFVTTPVGVSDSHSHSGGNLGTSVTWLGAGVDDPSALDSDGLREAMFARRTVASRGPFVLLDPAPGSTVAGNTTLQVEARSPSWIRVDRLRLLRDGTEVDRIEGTSGSFLLNPEADAAYVVIAEGDTSMAPVSNATPWALTSAVLVDLAGDGWDPPLPPLTLP